MIEVKVINNKSIKVSVAAPSTIKVGVCTPIVTRDVIPSNYGKITWDGFKLTVS